MPNQNPKNISQRGVYIAPDLKNTVYVMPVQLPPQLTTDKGKSFIRDTLCTTHRDFC